MPPALPPIPVNIRTFQPADADACKTLYVEGLIGGKNADNDTGLDIVDIPAAYLASDDSHFWVAQTTLEAPAPHLVVGMIGVQQVEPGVGEIRRLRVRADHQRRGIGTSLMETAVRFCRDRGHIKILLDTFMDREPALKLFQKFNFVHSRTRKVGEKELQYFYLDLYHREPQSEMERND